MEEGREGGGRERRMEEGKGRMNLILKWIRSIKKFVRKVWLSVCLVFCSLLLVKRKNYYLRMYGMSE